MRKGLVLSTFWPRTTMGHLPIGWLVVSSDSRSPPVPTISTLRKSLN